MSAIKSNEKVQGKYSFRTTITQEIYDEFRDTCKRMGVPMNIVLESFMKDFDMDEFREKKISLPIKSPKSALRTTITQEIYETFRDICKRTGVSLNLVLESFMKDFNAGLYEVCVRKTNH